MNINIVRSARRTISIEVRPDCSVVVRTPKRMSEAAVIDFIGRHQGWIDKKVALMHEKLQNEQNIPYKEPSENDIAELVNEAKSVIPKKVEKFAAVLGVDYGRITIRHQRTRWGSCSSKGNLNFNCMLMRCPDEVIDYVVIHELCHRIEMNHSKNFWALVESVMPDYRVQRRWLKEHAYRL